MQYGNMTTGKTPVGRMPLAPLGQIGKISVPSVDGYADIFDGVLEIRIDLDPISDAHKRFCKETGTSDQGYRYD